MHSDNFPNKVSEHSLGILMTYRQCDQKARLLVEYLAIYNNDKVPKNL